MDASPAKAGIVLAEMAPGVDYMGTGMNLRKVHLEDMSRSELIKRFSVASN